MPYFVAVLVLVVIGVGFTLFQNPSSLAETDSTSTVEPEAVAPEILPIQPAEPAPTPTEEPAISPNPEPSPSGKPETKPAPTPEPVILTDYKNGTYQTSGTYRTPEGNCRIDLTLTISSDVVTATDVSFESKGASDGYSKRFTNAYASQVIGQDLADIQLSRVGGASLTTKAFNSALSNIMSQAS